MTVERLPLSELHATGLLANGGAAQWCLDLCRQLGAEVSELATPATRLQPDDLIRLLAASGGDVLLVDSDVVETHELAQLVGICTSLADTGRIVVIFSPYGLSGPLCARRGSELTVQAISGVMSTNGSPGDPPLMTGVPVLRATAALLGLAAVLVAEIGGQNKGELIDVSLFDCAVCMMGTLLPNYFLTGAVPPRIGNRHPMSAPWNTYPTADGWVVLTTIGEPLWRRLANMLGCSELADDPRFIDAAARMKNIEALDSELSRQTRARTTSEIVAAASVAGVPASEIRELTQALHTAMNEHRSAVRYRGEQVMPGLPFQITPTGDSNAATDRGAGDVSVVTHWAPLANIRVVELGSLTSAPLAGRILGAMGAEVLKVEPPDGEASRHLVQQVDGCGYLYYMNNTDKRDCVLDLRSSQGRSAFLDIVAEADVMLTNLAPSSLARLKLSAQDVFAANPSIILCSVSGFGVNPRSSTDKAFDTVIQAMSGIMALTGLPGSPPTKTGMSFADLLGAWAATAGVAAGLRARRRSGRGQNVQIAMLDSALWTTQERWSEALNRGAEPTRIGNRDLRRSPHDVFACRDGLLALDAVDDAGWHRLANFLGFNTATAAREDAVAEALAGYTVSEALEAAATADVCAAPVLDLAALVRHPQVAARRLLPDMRTPAGQTIRVLGCPLKFRRMSVGVRRSAPSLGQHRPCW